MRASDECRKEFCGADAAATINREDFGVGWGKNFGFDMKVKLAIQVEALTAEVVELQRGGSQCGP